MRTKQVILLPIKLADWKWEVDPKFKFMFYFDLNKILIWNNLQYIYAVESYASSHTLWKYNSQYLTNIELLFAEITSAKLIKPHK